MKTNVPKIVMKMNVFYGCGCAWVKVHQLHNFMFIIHPRQMSADCDDVYRWTRKPAPRLACQQPVNHFFPASVSLSPGLATWGGSSWLMAPVPPPHDKSAWPAPLERLPSLKNLQGLDKSQFFPPYFLGLSWDHKHLCIFDIHVNKKCLDLFYSLNKEPGRMWGRTYRDAW